MIQVSLIGGAADSYTDTYTDTYTDVFLTTIHHQLPLTRFPLTNHSPPPIHHPRTYVGHPIEAREAGYPVSADLRGLNDLAAKLHRLENVLVTLY